MYRKGAVLTARITEYIEDRVDWLIAKTTGFIRTPGVSGFEGEIAKVLTGCLAESGLTALTDEAGNVVGAFEESSPAPDEGKVLAFNVHLDTVPAGNHQSWKYHPFGGIVEEGKIFGRGASDTKGAWAPIILAMEAVRNCGIRLEGRVIFTAVVMEELGLCAGMKALLESTLQNALPDYIILGEPTGLDIAIGHKGKTELEVITHGRACHASTPWMGENALYRAAAVIQAMEKKALEIDALPGDPLFGKSTLAMTNVTCTPGVRNIIPDSCAMYVDYRFLPGETMETVRASLERHLTMNKIEADIRVSREDGLTYTGLAVKGQKYIPAFGLDDGHVLVRKASDAAREVLLRSPRVYRWNFATDGGWSMGKLGIPTIGFSPCEEHLAHTVDEYVRIESLVSAAKVYAAMIIRLLNGREA